MKKKLKKRVPKYQDGGILKKTGQVAGNTGLAIGDTALGALGLGNVIDDKAYMGANASNWDTAGNVGGTIGKVALPMALSALGVPPQATMAGQAALSGLNPEEQAKASGIPLNQPTVENDPYNYFKMGGLIPQDNTIEVEGKELETSKGKILKDFNKQPAHKDGGYQYEAKPDRTIIPVKWRSRYMEGDKTTRTSIERNLVNEQAAREAEKGKSFNTAFDKWRKKGGYTIPKYQIGGDTPYDPYNTNAEVQDSLIPLYSQDAFSANNWEGSMQKPQYQFESLRDTPSPRAVSNPSLANSPANPNYVEPTPFYPTPNGQMPGNIPYSPTSNEPLVTLPQTTSKQNWSNYANKAAQFAPIAYNLGRGLQKPQVLNQEEFQNPYESQVRDLMSKRRVDFRPIENEIRSNYKNSLSTISGGAKSSGQVLSGGTALAGSRASTLAKAKLQADIANQEFRGEEASTLGNLGSQRAHTKLGIQDINDRNLGARNNFRGTAATQIGQYGAGANRDEIYKNMLEDMFSNYSFDSKTNKYTYKPS